MQSFRKCGEAAEDLEATWERDGSEDMSSDDEDADRSFRPAHKGFKGHGPGRRPASTKQVRMLAFFPLP